MLQRSTVGGQRLGELLPLHIVEHLSAQVVQRLQAQRVEPQGGHQGVAVVLHSRCLPDGQAPDGVGGTLCSKGRGHGAVPDELQRRCSGIGGIGGAQHGVDLRQSGGHHAGEVAQQSAAVGGSGGVGLVHSSLGQGQHLGDLVVIGRGIGAGVVERDGVIGQLIHVVLQMAGQVGIRHRSLAVHAVDQLQQVGALDEDALKPLDGVQADAVGLVGVAVLLHQLGGVAVGLCFFFRGQLAAQLLEAGLDGGVGLKVLHGFLAHIVADSGSLAAVGIHGDGLLQEGLHIGGILLRGGQISGLLVSVVLGQQIQARGDVHRADGAHRIRGGAAGGKGKYHCHGGKKCDQFLFHRYAPVVRVARPLRQRKRAATSPKGRGFGNSPQGLGEPPEAPPLGELAKPIGFD